MDAEDKIIEKAREIIREQGFCSASELIVDLVIWCAENDMKHNNIVPLLEFVPSEEDGIHSVEYANEGTKSFRRKDLFYYNPDVFFCDGNREEYINYTEG